MKLNICIYFSKTEGASKDPAKAAENPGGTNGVEGRPKGPRIQGNRAEGRPKGSWIQGYRTKADP